MNARILMLTVALAWAGLVPAHATGRPFPAFPLTALDGTIVQSVDAVPEGQALMVFVQAGCRPCEALLGALKADLMPGVAARTAVVVGGASVEETAAMKARYPDLQDAAWFADTQWVGWGQLRLSGVPIVEGVRNRSSLEWRLSGDQPSARLASVLGTWVAIAPPGGGQD